MWKGDVQKGDVQKARFPANSSEGARAISKVERRANALRRFDILDSTPEESFDAITRLASAICNTPMAAVSFLDADRQWFKSEVGLGVSETPLSESFCKHAADQQKLMVVRDTSVDPRFVNNNLVTAGPKLRFYAGCPLRARDGTAVGAVCVLDTVPRPGGLSATEQSTLEVLARQIEDQLELRAAMKDGERQLAALHRLTEELAFRGSHDPLTTLPNRSHFAERLHRGLQECDRTGASLTLILLDVDHFKQTNDALGHDAGDALLCGFGASIRSVIRATDTVARIGGDEFAVILRDVPENGPSRAVIDQIGHQIRRPIQHRGRTIECHASIGFSTYPKDAATIECLTKASDLALAAAKLTRGSAVKFESELLDKFEGQIRSLENVRSNFVSDQFEPYYQPKISLLTGKRVGFEALMRWHQSGAASVPNIFDAEFPDKHLVAQIGLRMIEKILDDLRRWTTSGFHVGRVAINSSAIEFAGDDFAENLLAQLSSRNLSPCLIELEVTEGVLLGRGASHIARALHVLRAAGVTIALDDFGTGYASLIHLRQFPLDVLKVDQSFVAGITRSADDAAIVRAVIGLAKNLAIVTVAEGVETPAQEAFIRHHGCDIGQGFLYGAAVPATAILLHSEAQHDAA